MPHAYEGDKQNGKSQAVLIFCVRQLGEEAAREECNVVPPLARMTWPLSRLRQDAIADLLARNADGRAIAAGSGVGRSR